jgi:hypothetical protein
MLGRAFPQREQHRDKEVDVTKHTRWLIAGTASALIAGSGLAFGQGMQQAPSGGASGGTSMGGGMQGGSSTERSGSSTERNLSGSGATSGQESGSMRGSQPSTSGQSSSSGRTQSEQPQAQERGGATRSETQRSGTQSQQRGTSSQTSGQGSASSGASTSINLSSQQRTQIKQVVVRHSDIPHVNDVNVNIAVGAALPSTVALIDVPEDVVTVFPRFRRHKIVIIKNQIVIVEPSSLKIVAVLPA